jgi:sporulation integral membrane protein YtvI
MKQGKFITYVKIIINFIFAILVALFLMLVLPRILKFFLPFVIGWIVAMIANPLVHFLEKRVKIVRKHSSAIIIAMVILIIVGAATLLTVVIVKEAKGLMNDVPEIVETVKEQFEQASRYIDKATAPLPDNIQAAISNAIDGLDNSVSEYMNNKDILSVSSAGNLVGNVAEGFLAVIVTILSAYFFAAGRNELTAGLRRKLPESIQNYWRLIFDNFKSAFGGYFKAQFKIMLVLTVIMFIGFEILQVGYSFLFAIGIAFLDLLPVFGTGAILWPWAIMDMLSGNYFRAIGLVVIYLICQIVKQVLQPKMVGDSIGLHPLATLIFMYIGYRFYGILGIIIGIPVGMVLVNLYRIGVFERIIRGFKIIAQDLNDFRKF